MGSAKWSNGLLSARPTPPRRQAMACKWPRDCLDPQSHEAHASPLETISKPDARLYDLYVALHTLNSSTISSVNSNLSFTERYASRCFKAIFMRPVFERELLPIMVDISSSWDFEFILDPETGLSFQEILLQEIADVPRELLKVLASSPSLSPEGVLSFFSQKHYYDLLGFTLWRNLDKDRSPPHARNSREAFVLASPQLRVAIALTRFPENNRQTPGKVVLSRAKTLLNQHNANPAAALELIEVMAKEWHGSFEDFAHMVKALI